MGTLQPFSFTENKLIAFYLGGRAPRCSLELHDVMFLVGKSSEELIPQIKENWFGTPKSLHVDSWLALENVEGYDITVSKGQNNNQRKSKDDLKLYFVNLGAYKKEVFGEMHYMKFLVAESPLEAKNKAKKNLENDLVELHTDDLYDIDDCIEIEKIGPYTVQLSRGQKSNVDPVNGWQRVL
ncbi:MAG: DUF1543 domain-containing protein [Bdellovibrionales bacterium]|nr:DUF1543 domain-containing protein [Bdellovibrionales bacterium]